MRRPNLLELTQALRLTAMLLDATHADYCFEGRFRFELAGEWSLVVSPDDAGRLRLDCCYRSRPRCTLWTPARDHVRLAELVLGARQETEILA